MLKERVVSGAIAALVVAVGVFALPSAWFAAAVSAALLVPAWEWAGLAGLTSGQSKAAFLAVLLVSMVACVGLDSRYPQTLDTLVFVGFLFWWFACWRILRYARRPMAAGSVRSVLVAGLFVLLPCWAALLGLHRIPNLGPTLIMVLLALVWATDIGAFFVGRKWGQRKLAPAVSPGKTVAGVWGGFGCALLIAGLAPLTLDLGVEKWPLFVAVSLLTVGFAVAGDLFESMVKRQRDVKDSGSLLPGHGGALDRLDSLTAAAPVFALGMTWLLGNPH